jgi:hypothetical protein
MCAIALACLGFLLGQQPWMQLAASGLVGKLFAVGIPSLLGMAAFLAGAVVFRLIKPARFFSSLPFGFGKHYLAASPAAESEQP